MHQSIGVARGVPNPTFGEQGGRQSNYQLRQCFRCEEATIAPAGAAEAALGTNKDSEEQLHDGSRQPAIG